VDKKDLKQEVKEKANQAVVFFHNNWKSLLFAGGAFVALAYLSSRENDVENENYDYDYDDDSDSAMINLLKCANCGASDKLHDEGDIVYCTHCSQRTQKSNGKIYLTKCPHCRKKTRGGAAYCEACMGWKGE